MRYQLWKVKRCMALRIGPAVKISHTAETLFDKVCKSIYPTHVHKT